MNKYLSPLKFKNILTLIGLIVIGFGWLLIDQIFLSETYQRFIAFSILICILFYLQFVLNKPDKIMQYANTISLITVSFILIVILILHVLITNDFSYKQILILVISGSLPYLTGFIYIKTMKK
jgi:hypothetical protein